MEAASMRFVGELNDLLPRALRHTTIRQPTYDGAQSVKHLSEALGIPHTEIGWIVANGRSVAFDHLVQPGDDILLHPFGPAPAVKPLLPLRPPLPRPARFLLDNHLGRLARLLRLLGLDALYFNNDLDDAQLAARAGAEERVLLTRDRGLLKRSAVIYGYCLRSTDSQEQLRAVLARYELSAALRPWTRCLRCNGLLRRTSKTAVLDRLEPRTRLYYDDFFICDDCAQLYWRGSHYEALQDFVQSILDETSPL